MIDLQELAESEKISDYIDDADLDINSLTTYLKKKFSSREESEAKAISELLGELLKADYRQLSKLDQNLEKGKRAFENYESQHPTMDGKHKRVGVVRATLSIVDSNYLAQREGYSASSPYWQEYERFRKFVDN